MTLKTHWVLVVMDEFARRIMGFGVQAGDVDGVAPTAPRYARQPDGPIQKTGRRVVKRT